MKKLAIAFAGLAALGFSGAAFAGDATQGARSTTATPATTTAPTAMSDSDMDKVTAAGQPDQVGLGLTTATEAPRSTPHFVGAVPRPGNDPDSQGFINGIGTAHKP